MNRYSKERREAILKLLLPPHNLTVAEISKQENISDKTLYNWRNKVKTSGQPVPCKTKTTEDWSVETKLAAIANVERIIKRFHKVARQLRSRYADRPAIEIEDEYDVQDVFHALLKLFFDDVRPEEYTPSYAGSASRVDFLLKSEQIIIEIKKTRKGLAAKQIGEQLIIDSQRYQAHPDCKHLVCFVYDPEGRVANPNGIEKDLTKEINGTPVSVFIYPKD